MGKHPKVTGDRNDRNTAEQTGKDKQEPPGDEETALTFEKTDPVEKHGERQRVSDLLTEETARHRTQR